MTEGGGKHNLRSRGKIINGAIDLSDKGGSDIDSVEEQSKKSKMKQEITSEHEVFEQLLANYLLKLAEDSHLKYH